MLYVTFTLNFLLMLAMPFLLAAFLARRLGTRWGLVWVGTVTFITSQIVHLPLNAVLGRIGLIQPAKSGWPLVVLAAVLGLSAGVCEEVARYLALRFWLKRDRSWRAALMFGAGHGGVESVIVGAITAIGAINIFVLSNVDPARLGISADKLPALQAQLATAWNLPVLYPLLGAFERLLAISTHLFLAVLVMQAFTRKNILWLIAAILWHALTDAVAVYASTAWGVYATEGLIAVLALVGLALMFALRQPEPLPVAPAAAPPPPAAAPDLASATPTADQLDRTRFQ
jgi:uncharacterized membrane protein YhfC